MEEKGNAVYMRPVAGRGFYAARAANRPPGEHAQAAVCRSATAATHKRHPCLLNIAYRQDTVSTATCRCTTAGIDTAKDISIFTGTQIRSVLI